ncbi:MAG: hypothetical protein ACTSWW_01540 [Promethearchaeota archaeon]
MEDLSYLVELFENISIKEKGIEQIYDYLLHNKIIEDPKSIVEEFDLSLKRIYKILSLLKSLGLVQTYDRPMKAVLNTPLDAWQTIISNQIRDIELTASQQKTKCETAFQNMVDHYDLNPDLPDLPPVEYISMAGDDPFDFLINDLIGTPREICLAKGVKFRIEYLKKAIDIIKNPQTLQNYDYTGIEDIWDKFEKGFSQKTVKVLISHEWAEEALQGLPQMLKDITLLTNYLSKVKLDIEIKISQQPVGNFILKDTTELLQFSVDPTNNLLGLFVSRQTEIVDIFQNKFMEIYQTSEDFNDYIHNALGRDATMSDKLGFLIL